MPQKDLLNKNNILNIAFALSIKVTFTFLTIAPSLCLNIIYKQLILTAIYYTDFHLIPVPYSVSTTYKNEAITYIL